VYSNLADAEARQVFIKKKFEDYGYFKLAEFFLPLGGTHFDVGANYGFQTFGMINKLKNKKIKYFLFEPNIDCHNCHNKTATLHPNENIINHPIAITSFNGSAHFFYCKEYSGGGTVYNTSELNEKNLHKSVNNSYEVSCTVLDTVLLEQNINSIDLLKIDVEGSEYKILEGANTALSKGIIKAAYIEINTEALENHGSSPKEIFNLLENNNYKLFYPHTEGSTEIRILKIYGKELSLSLLNKDKIIYDSKDSVVLLDILAIHSTLVNHKIQN
jgi:FkbM family methyltransferase